MIAWIVASNKPDVLERNLLATLDLCDEDEVIVILDPPSLSHAYATGQRRATRPIRCYVHSDVQILDPAKLRAELKTHCTTEWGMVGVVGSRNWAMPWWDGAKLGSVIDARMGELNFGPGGPCATLDGLLLATAQTVAWDEDWPGFHGYDADACRMMLADGLSNFCLTDGHKLVLHNATSSTSLTDLPGWEDAVTRYQKKWEQT